MAQHTCHRPSLISTANISRDKGSHIMPGKVQKLEHTHWGWTPLASSAPAPDLEGSLFLTLCSPHSSTSSPQNAPGEEQSTLQASPSDLNPAHELQSPGNREKAILPLSWEKPREQSDFLTGPIQFNITNYSRNLDLWTLRFNRVS